MTKKRETIAEAAVRLKHLDMAQAFAPDSLGTVSLELDETIREAEEFLQDLGLGVQAFAPLLPIGDDHPEKDCFVGFMRLKDGWRLVYITPVNPPATDYDQLPLIEVSRQRKRFAMAQFGALVAQTKQEAANLVEQLRDVIRHVKSVMDQERSK